MDQIIQDLLKSYKSANDKLQKDIERKTYIENFTLIYDLLLNNWETNKISENITEDLKESYNQLFDLYKINIKYKIILKPELREQYYKKRNENLDQ